MFVCQTLGFRRIVSVRKVGILVKFPRSIVVVTLDPCFGGVMSVKATSKSVRLRV